jgi:predicted DNA-binding transcriptional regulator AlpA
MENERLIEVPEVLRKLKISRKTLYKLIKKRVIHPIEKPSYMERVAKLQFHEEEIDQLLNGDSDDPNNYAA